MVIEQGEIYWVDLGEPSGSAPGYRHPHIVIQNNLSEVSRFYRGYDLGSITSGKMLL